MSNYNAKEYAEKVRAAAARRYAMSENQNQGKNQLSEQPIINYNNKLNNNYNIINYNDKNIVIDKLKSWGVHHPETEVNRYSEWAVNEAIYRTEWKIKNAKRKIYPGAYYKTVVKNLAKQAS